MDIDAGLLCLSIAYDAVENVERVEKEMRIDLTLELEIAVLRHIRLFPFAEHLALRSDCIVYDENDAVDGYLCYERYAEKKNEICVFESDEEGFEQSRKDHERNIHDTSADCRCGLRSPRYRPDEQYIDADQDDGGECVGHHFPDQVEYEALVKRRS